MNTYYFELDDSNHVRDVVIAITALTQELAEAKLQLLFVGGTWPRADDFVLRDKG